MSVVDLGHPADVEPRLDSLSRRMAHRSSWFRGSQDAKQGPGQGCRIDWLDQDARPAVLDDLGQASHPRRDDRGAARRPRLPGQLEASPPSDSSARSNP